MSGGKQAPEQITLAPTDYFRVIEERRRAAEGVLWQLPSISLAAQAFLLSAGLSSDAAPSSQVVVGALGIGAVLGTGLFVLYQAMRATVFEQWVSRTVSQPLATEELLATGGLGFSARKSCLIRGVFKAFYVVCVCALLALLGADGYVFGRGVGWW